MECANGNACQSLCTHVLKMKHKHISVDLVIDEVITKLNQEMHIWEMYMYIS